MSSDSDDEEQVRKFLEASDTTLLHNGMFKDKHEEDNELNNKVACEKLDHLKSQRYVAIEDEAGGTDFNLPASMQKHMAKKLSEMLEKTYYFCDIEERSDGKKIRIKSRVRLLKDYEDYVKPYEEFEYETKGPEKKPVIKRRCVDKPCDSCAPTQFQLDAIAIDGNDIIAANETKYWAVKKERKDKVFHYRQGVNGIAHAKEVTNEFTTLRRKNKWNESKIKDFKRS
ncbi:uncharacterized protein LOC142228664 [Haematobia irritans]|uniref:uncharacterized protein LOC142228664 n=1 Tax=Haematobia irritans TaxID=7368 RepID=UPI003F5064ED